MKVYLKGKECQAILPAVRPASDGEISACEEQKKEAEGNAVFAEKLNVLGEVRIYDLESGEDTEYPPDPYGMTIPEHNMALMLLYSHRSTPGFSTRVMIERLLNDVPEENGGESEKIRIATDYYTSIRRFFKRDVDAEMAEYVRSGRELPKNLDEVDWDDLPPAMRAFYSFRNDNGFAVMMGELPNKGNANRVKPTELVQNPSDGYIHFLTDWYNSLE